MKQLCIVGTAEDSQTSNWIRIAQECGAYVHFFDVHSLNDNWQLYFTASAQGVRTSRQGLFPFSKDCWYFRGPLHADPKVLTQMHLIHSSLSLHAYPRGNYFTPPSVEADLLSKPTQNSFFDGSFPYTRITSAEKISTSDHDYVVKSISHIRSQVNTLKRILESFNHTDDSLAGPVMLQEYITGVTVKVHCYLSRSGVLKFFACSCQSAAIDYRYASTDYAEYPCTDLLRTHANKIHERTKAKFFDFDMIIQDAHSGVLLEVNFSPAPTFFERNLKNGFTFSRLIIRDWLCIQ